MGGSSPYPGETHCHPFPSHLIWSRREGVPVWIEVGPRNTVEEEGDFGGWEELF